MHNGGSRTGIGRHTGVIPRIRNERLGDQEFTGSTRFGFFCFQTDATSWGVKINHGVAMIPKYTRRGR